jgi:DNA primase
VQLLRRHPKVVLWLDNDDAGWGAIEDLHDNKGKVSREGLISSLSGHTKLYIVDNPWNADPADLSDDEVDRLIAGAVPWPLWSRPTSLKEWKEVLV